MYVTDEMETDSKLFDNIKNGYKEGVILLLGLAFCVGTADAQRQMERLDRGMVAVSDGAHVYVGWRMLGTDPKDIAFNLYRITGSAEPVKLNQDPITSSTNYVDDEAELSKSNTYFVRSVLNGTEGEASKPVETWNHHYLAIPLQTPNGYTPNDASVGDLDGDGDYDIVLHQVGKSKDNSQSGYTDEPILEAYQLDGTLLWQINLGKNIREGAHYTQFIVYDLDGDGKAELACKTADGTIDGEGNVVGDASADWRNEDGKILDGPEFFTIFDGQTGKALATTNYIPGRGDICGWGGVGGNGGNDCSGNRVDRFLAGIAYLDGERPSVVMCRGYYGRTVLAAWDWRDRNLTSRWIFDSAESGLEKFSGQGNHSLSIADVDGDGKDEIVYGSMTVDDDGTGLYSTGLRHGDAGHVSDLDPLRPGLEVWGIHENEVPVPGYENGYGVALFDAKTGEIIWGGDKGKDVGRGLAADVDPRHLGAEMWGGSVGLRDAKGKRISHSPSSANFAIWWDGDLLRELLDKNYIDKWDYKSGELVRLFTAEGCSANNGSKANPALSADLFGDWREEVMFRTTDNKELRIFTTTIPTKHRLYTLMHNPHYRLSIACQNVGYNQPPHTSFYLGEGMKEVPDPSIVVAPKADR